MPTRIFFQNGEQVTVSESPDAVAQKLAGSGFAQLDRPWGDEAIYVNPASINYIEAQDERAPDIAALEAVPDAGPAPRAPAPGAPARGGGLGGPPQRGGQAPPPAGGTQFR